MAATWRWAKPTWPRKFWPKFRTKWRNTWRRTILSPAHQPRSPLLLPLLPRPLPRCGDSIHHYHPLCCFCYHPSPIYQIPGKANVHSSSAASTRYFLEKTLKTAQRINQSSQHFRLFMNNIYLLFYAVHCHALLMNYLYTNNGRLVKKSFETAITTK